MSAPDLHARMAATIARRGLVEAGAPVVLMVSGGSDSTALAYLAADLSAQGVVGPATILHVNHRLRGAESDEDARFVARLAALLGIPFAVREVDVAGRAAETGGNIEAVARTLRYQAASEVLADVCDRVGTPCERGRILTAHTADDRVENFYMRSIVGTGPGGFRSMTYRTGAVVRPLLDVGRDELRAFLQTRAAAGEPVVRDGEGALWREDATNAHTDRLRAYVRHEIVPLAKARNPRLVEVLSRSMNLIADEDDMLQDMARELEERFVRRERGPAPAAGAALGAASTPAAGADVCAYVLLPGLGEAPLPLRRRVVVDALRELLGPDARVETASVDAVLAAWEALPSATAAREEPASAAEGQPAPSAAEAQPAPSAGADANASGARIRGGYVANIQGDLAVSANKRGVRIEPMAAYRARRKRV